MGVAIWAPPFGRQPFWRQRVLSPVRFGAGRTYIQNGRRPNAGARINGRCPNRGAQTSRTIFKQVAAPKAVVLARRIYIDDGRLGINGKTEEEKVSPKWLITYTI